MRLNRLIEDVDVRSVGPGDPSRIDVTAVVHDTGQVTPGALYCCVPGATADGHDFAGSAVESGAVALLCERPLDVDALQVVVPSTRQAMPLVAAAFWGHPSRLLTVVGVTGTNGKTTTTHLLAGILEAHGWPTGVLGTLTGVRTTPESPELQAQLAGFLAAGKRAVVMEVSSHALAQHRADAVRFAAAVFTNLSQDHLDYHGTMEEYFKAKALLFEHDRSDLTIVNRDDAWGERLLRSRVDALTFGMSDAARLAVGQRGSTFVWRAQTINLPLGGRFNVMNALAAAETAHALGVAPHVIARALSNAKPVPGRYQAVDLGQDFTVLVDYAHTPDGLEQLLASARQGAEEGARVAVVFGCGGDRDRAKRPLMGEVATRLADVAIVTSDNPRSEDPRAIIDEVRAGVPGDRRNLIIEEDRAAAIARAVSDAHRGDVVVIAGKGHETGQEIAGRVHPFDDREKACRALKARLAGSGGNG